MKITSDGVKATAYIAVGVVAVYAAYRVFRLGESATESIAATFRGAKDAVSSTLHRVGIGLPNLAELPSNEGYPEPGQVRNAYDEAARIDDVLLDNYNAIIDGGVSALMDQRLYLSSPQAYSPSADMERV